VGLRDAAQAAIQRRHFVRAGQITQIQRHGVGLGGQGVEPMQRAPFRKVEPVEAVCLQRVGRFGVGGEVAGIVGDLLEAGERELLVVVVSVETRVGSVSDDQPRPRFRTLSSGVGRVRAIAPRLHGQCVAVRIGMIA
jgi:hypothetical protein